MPPGFADVGRTTVYFVAIAISSANSSAND